MENKIKPRRSVSFAKWLVLVFAILSTFSLLASVLSFIRPRSGQSFNLSFLVLSSVASPLFFTAFFAIQKRKRYGRWLAIVSFALAACNVIWALFWYFVVYDGSRNIFTTGLVVGLDIVQFALLLWGALTFAFPPKLSPEDAPAASYLPPPPPSFDSHEE